MSAGAPNGLDGLTGEIEALRKKLSKSRKNNSVLTTSNLICIVAMLIAVVAYVKRAPIYFAFTPSMQIMEMMPLSEPTYRDADIGIWATRVTCRTMSINFKQWVTQLEDVRRYYSQEAMKDIVTDIKTNGNLAKITGDRLIAHVIPSEAAVLTAKGDLQGKYTWKYEIPLMVSLESSDGVESTENWLATVLIQRASLLEYPEGIRIIQLNVRAR